MAIFYIILDGECEVFELDKEAYNNAILEEEDSLLRMNGFEGRKRILQMEYSNLIKVRSIKAGESIGGSDFDITKTYVKSKTNVEFLLVDKKRFQSIKEKADLSGGSSVGVKLDLFSSTCPLFSNLKFPAEQSLTKYCEIRIASPREM